MRSEIRPDVEPALKAALSSLAAEAAALRMPARMEQQLMTEFDARLRVRDKPLLSARAFAAALAACLAAVAVIYPTSSRLPAAPEPEAFVPIPYTAPLAPYERTEVLRMDVPVAALIAAGFEVHAPDAGASVRADVLVGQDGRARAFRLVPDSYRERRLNP